MKSGLWKRLPVLLFVAAGIFLWKGGLGLLPTDRTVIFRLPASYADVRQLKLEVWEDGALLKRSELNLPKGLSTEPQMTVPLAKGPHHAVAMWKIEGKPESVKWAKDFDPGSADTVVLVDQR